MKNIKPHEVGDVLTIYDGNIKGIWTNLYEGFNGDYGPYIDSEDENLLRFELSYKYNGTDYEEVPDSSYCTVVNADTALPKLAQLMELIIKETKDAVASYGHAKKICEQLSHMSASMLVETKDSKKIASMLEEQIQAAEEAFAGHDFGLPVEEACPFTCEIDKNNKEVVLTRSLGLQNPDGILEDLIEAEFSVHMKFNGKIKNIEAKDKEGNLLVAHENMSEGQGEDLGPRM